ncbi:hypothetical protein LSAT2_011477 [Lamellibrachia satsuma]|nr:hypothetical protein LSAT2_011477 [Lamellibrachia satsuma]
MLPSRSSSLQQPSVHLCSTASIAICGYVVNKCLWRTFQLRVNTWKVWVILFNAALCVAGAAAAVLGILIPMQLIDSLKLLSFFPYTLIVALIGGGATLSGIAIFGLFCVFFRQPLMLRLHSVLATIAFVPLVIGTVVVFDYYNKVDTNMEEYMIGKIEKYKPSATMAEDSNNNCQIVALRPPALWDHVMVFFHCCGSRHYLDYERYSKHWKRQVKCYGAHFQLRVPLPCCKMAPGYQRADATLAKFTNLKRCVKYIDPNHIIMKPCARLIRDYVLPKTKWLKIYIVAVTVVQLLAAVSSVCLLYAVIRAPDTVYVPKPRTTSNIRVPTKVNDDLTVLRLILQDAAPIPTDQTLPQECTRLHGPWDRAKTVNAPAKTARPAPRM